MKGRKLVHTGVPQEPENVPIDSLLYRRSGSPNYYFRRRIPLDLVDAYDGKKEIKKSLGTSKKTEAEDRAHFLAIKFNKEWNQKRNELAAKGVEGFVHRTNSDSSMRPLSSLSALEREAFIHEVFIRLEAAAVDRGDRDFSELSELDLADRIGTIKDDLAAKMSQQEGNGWDVDALLAVELAERGIEIGTDAESALREIRPLFIRAHVESDSRTLRILGGELNPHGDKQFEKLESISSPPEVSPSVTLSKLFDEYRRHQQEVGVAAKTMAKVEFRFRLLRELFGEHTPVAKIQRDGARKIIRFLKSFPSNAIKRYSPKLTLEEMGELENAQAKPLLISPRTIRDHYQGLSAIMNYAAGEGWIGSNPLSGRTLARELPEVEMKPKQMMRPEEINLVFTNEKFVSERNKGPRGEARFWVPLICLFHGCRSNEACQLLVSDVREEDAISFFSIDIVDEGGNRVKSLKTKASVRRIPVHKELIAMGFLDYVESQRKRQEKWLFPGLTTRADGSRNNAVGQWFRRLRKELLSDLPEQIGAKSLHSFRGSFERELRDQGVSDSLQYYLGGWSDKKPQNSSVFYGDGFGIKALKEAMDKVEYSGVDLSALHVDSGA